jgi:chloramphenicol-sensitive protein RarD
MIDEKLNSNPNNNNTINEHSRGLILGFMAFAWWGMGPLYFKLLAGIDPVEIMAHRVIWSLVVLILAIWLLNRQFKILEIIKTPSLIIGLFLSGSLVSANWLIYVWAISHDRILETSLGYFINPLVSVALGMLFLNEKLTTKQWIALALVILSIINQIWHYGTLPWISLSLAFSFGFYGLIRKKLIVDSFNGLLMEVILVFPIALGFLIYQHSYELNTSDINNWSQSLLLFLTGVFTVVPMALFAASVRIIKLSTIGFIQYLAPSITFILAIYVFKEPLGMTQLISFILIWIALLFISWDTLKLIMKKVLHHL